MGTRHLQTVINKEGEKKLNQYGQWDGYPDGQGKDILKFLRNADLLKYQNEINKLKEPSLKKAKEIDADPNWAEKYPYLSRDCGSKIHKMIEQGKVKFVGLMNDEEANRWCRGFYTINFQTNEFITDYGGKVTTYKLDQLPTVEQYLIDTKNED